MRKTNAIVPTCLLLCAATTGFAQTQIDLGRQGRSPDFGGAAWTRPAKTGVLLPQTCSIGELYFKSDAPEGQNLYGCTTPNTWTLQSSGASGGGTPTAGTLNFSKSFSNQTAVTVNGVEHGFQSANLIVQVVNDATPGVRIEPDAVTIHPTTFDVSVTFQTPQSGRIIVNGTGILTSFEKSFWKSTNVSVTGSEHGLGSAKFGWFCFDAGSPKRWIEPNEVTIDPTTYDFQATFASEQSGSCTLVAGGGQGSTAGGSVNSVFGRTGTVLAQAGDYVASQIQNTPSGNLTATDLQSAVNELDAAKSATSHGHTLAGDATGSLTGVTVSRIQGRSLAATAPLDGQTLVWSTAGNQWQPGTIAGGGGASNAADLNDFKVAKTSGAVLTLNSGCSVAKPCVARFGNRSYAFTTSATATISGGTGQARWYVDPAGTIILGHAGLTVSCSGCVAQNNLTQFPTESIPLFVWNATSGVWDDTGSDYRAYLSTKQVAAGTGVTVSESGGVATVAVDTATVGTFSSGTAAPGATCTVGQKYNRTDTNQSYECTSTNTWTETTGGGGSGLGDPGADGMVARTALNTTAARTITGTSNEIAVTNGDGVYGNPTLALAESVDLSGKTSTSPMKVGTSDPATCDATKREMFYNSTSNTLKVCNTTDTWTAVGGGSGAPTDAQYVTLAANSTLTNERKLTPRDNLTATDGGAGGNYTLDFNPLDRSVVWLVDDFFGGLTTSGNIGDLGWSGVTSGSGTFAAPSAAGNAEHPWVLGMTTGATNGNASAIAWGGAGTGANLVGLNSHAWEIQWIFRTGSSVDAMSIQAALCEDSSAGAGCGGGSATMRVRYDTTADTAWVVRKRDTGTADATVCTGSEAPAANTWYRAVMTSDGSTVYIHLYNDGGSTDIFTSCSFSTFADAIGLAPVFGVRTNEAVAKSAYIDWFSFKMRGLSR